MRISTLAPKSARVIVPALAALALAACGGGTEEETTYETDVVDESGGEFIVSDVDPNAVPVDTPDTPMTPVPEGEEEAPAEGAPEE